ncbi:C40 family peptidase [Pseudoxanthomonas sp. JBR18]|uniref:C40 family peptidase n=1 Tax=Pseudoxanthomonas sp. JBR18 TaxID=2969308 RepID=UPI002305789D|nr:C40 family peptidase [Pseudoxanthomonas sp. JBR18]WCE06463.1 C40 family peptidase [Pseudoxanthomonas sp. JBR18]
MAQEAAPAPQAAAEAPTANDSSSSVILTSPVATTVATGVPTVLSDAARASTPAGQPIQTGAAPAVALAAAASAPAAAVAPTAVAATVSSPSLRDKATEAAAATLTALLPRLAATDTVPVMDRSAMLAGDLSRLLSNYNLTGAAAAHDSEVGKVQSVLQRALTLLGTPYRWGGSDPDSGLDCSGLVSYVFRTALGIDLPRVSRDMAANDNAELIKSRDELRQGDLVFFGRRGRVNHVGIYVGEGRFLHSPSAGKDVRVDSLTSGYWASRFVQARRVAM